MGASPGLSGDAVSRRGCSTVLRRFTGPEADEIAILCRPSDPSQDAAAQADAVYRALAQALTAHGVSPGDLTGETLFLRDVRRDLPLVLGARTRALADLGQAACGPLPGFIGQAPLDDRAAFELLASAVVPRDRDAWSARDVRPEASCTCEGCARSGARLIRLGEQISLHTTNLYGRGGDVYEQAWEMFRTAERLLDGCGMGFRDVVRTWIHLRDIDRDYDALNAARREFFQRCGVEQRPASTGVQGIPFPDLHDCSLSLHAVKSSRPLDVTGMSTPFLNEAWSYGADFSRGLRLVEANKVLLYVSGTASVGEGGQTVHAGEIEAQAERMVDNIASLLSRQGASFADLISGVTYLKRPSDAPVLRSRYRRRGFEGFPCALVEAPLCRPDLLCEAEVVAMLPPEMAEA
jgi:enamine deaminase RidA (YjgF/YER057c/UK114 family)